MGHVVGLICGKIMTAAMVPRMPMGTLMMKISRQSTYSTSAPPSVGPMAGATTTPSPYMPIAVPIRAGGTIWKSSVIVATGSTPPGIACRTRKAIMLSRFQARPQSPDPTANPTIEMT